MDLDLSNPRTISDASAKAETGRTLRQWFSLLDDAGGLALGRSAIGKFLMTDHGVDPWWVTTLTVEFERARGQLEKDGRPKGYSICSTKTLAAPVELAYQALHGMRTLHAGEFSKATPGKLLRFNWSHPKAGNGSQVEILIQAKGEKSGLVVNHTRIQTRVEADALRGMWEQELAALKQRLG